MHRSGIYIEHAFRGKASEYRDSIFIHEEASMLREESRLISGRRSFLKAALPGGALLCLGGGCLLRQARAQDRPKTAAQKHKFLEDSGMSLTEVFIIAYVPQLTNLAEARACKPFLLTISTSRTTGVSSAEGRAIIYR